MAALRKVKRLGKRASKFKLTCTVQSCLIELNTKRWSPSDICVVWSRRGRKNASEYRQWEPAVTNSLKGQLVWPDSSPVDFNVTLYRSSKQALFESKTWQYFVVDRDRVGKKTILAKGSVDMAYHVQQPMESIISVDMKATSKKITRVKIEICLTSELLKEGKATDDDMLSIASLSSAGIPDDLGYLEEDDCSDVDESREDLTSSVSPRPSSPFIPLPESVVPEQLLAWAQSVTHEYRSVKLVNMTTSWRNGLGFLAIVHHFRPELLDYPSLSSVHIRDNICMVRDLCRQLHISCPIRPDVMESSAPLQADVIAAFVYQLYLGLTKEGPESLPPAPKIPQDMKSGYSNGSSSFSSGNDALADFLIPPGVHRQKPPTLLGLESGNLGNEPRMTSPEELHLRETSNASPNGGHVPIMEYTASPTFLRPQYKMYGGAEEDQSSSEDEDSRMGRDDSQTVRIRKVSDVKAEKEGLQEEGAWKGGRETCISGGAEVGGSHPQGQVDSTAQGLTVLDALREGHQTEGGVSSGPDSNVSSPSRPSQLSVSEISLTEVTIPEALPTLAEETADTRQEVVSKHKQGKGDSAKENRRRLPPVPGAVRGGSGGASDEGPLSDECNRDPMKTTRQPLSNGALETAASSSPKPHDVKKGVPVTARPPTSASRRLTAPSNHLPLNHYGNSPPPPMPSKDKRRRASEDPSALSEGENLPVRRLPQPKKATSASQLEPFERPATADILDDKVEEDSPKPLRKRVSSFDTLPGDSSHSTSNRRRRTKASLKTILDNQGFSSNTPSASALEKSYQPPEDVSSRHNVLEGLEVPQKEERIENLHIQSGKRGLLKALTREENGRDPPPTLEETEHSREPQCKEDDTAQEGGLKSVVEYHREEKMEIQEQLEALERERELIQCDLNNARSKGDREKLQGLTYKWLDMLKKKNHLIHRQTEIDIMTKEEELERRRYEVHRELKKFQVLEEYQKTRGEKEREDKLVEDLVAIVDERAVLEERKLAYEINKENEAEGIEQAGLAMTSDSFTGDLTPSKKDCTVM